MRDFPSVLRDAAKRLSQLDEQAGRYRVLANKVEAAAANMVSCPSTENMKELNALFAQGQRMLDLPVHVAYTRPPPESG
jgi:hypothetical protein